MYLYMWSIDRCVCHLCVYVWRLWLECLALGMFGTSRTYLLCVKPSMNLIPCCINHTHTRLHDQPRKQGLTRERG